MLRRQWHDFRTIPLLLGLAVALALGLLVVPSATQSSGAESPCVPLTSDVYSRYSPSLSTSLLTLSSGEAAKAGTKYGFTGDRGTPFRASASSRSGLVEVKRLYSSSRGDFQFLARQADIDNAVAAGYAVQKTAFYALASAASDGCSVPVYRMTKGTKHQFVTPDDESALLASGWSNSGAAFHALPEGATPSPTPTTAFAQHAGMRP